MSKSTLIRCAQFSYRQNVVAKDFTFVRFKIAKGNIVWVTRESATLLFVRLQLIMLYPPISNVNQGMQKIDVVCCDLIYNGLKQERNV